MLPSYFTSLLLPLFSYRGQDSVLLLLAGARSVFKSCRQEQDVSTPGSGNKCSNFAVVQGTTSSERLAAVALMISSDTVSRLTN